MDEGADIIEPVNDSVVQVATVYPIAQIAERRDREDGDAEIHGIILPRGGCRSQKRKSGDVDF